MVPEEDMARAVDVHRRLEAAVEPLGDDDVRRPSLLPDWTVAHLLTHLARNADSVRRRAEGAARGEMVDQYAGGYAGRAAEIEAGAGRTATALAADVRISDAELESTWATLPAAAWRHPTRDIGGNERPLHELPYRRWMEVEVHLVDLGIGITYEDWSADFVEARLPSLRAGLAERLPPGATAPPRGSLTPNEEVAWLYGRLERDDLPALAPWG